MIYLLVKYHYSWLESHHFGFLRVFNDVTFQSTAAVILSFSLVMLLGPGLSAGCAGKKSATMPTSIRRRWTR